MIWAQWFMLAGLSLVASVAAQAAVLQVGPGKPYTTVQAAHNAAANGDTVEVHGGGVYRGADAQLFLTKSLTVKGIGDRPQFDCEGTAVALKGCWLIESTPGSQQVVIENVEIFDVETDGAGSCVRHQDEGTLTLRHVYLHHCEHGLLTGNSGVHKVTIEDSEFRENGIGDGLTHNIYVGESAELLMTRSRSYNSDGGQLVKSRAKKNTLTYNDLGDPQATPSSNYEVDLSCGGNAYIVGNKIHQSAGSTNKTMIRFGAENCVSGDQHLVVAGNMFHNDVQSPNNTGNDGNIFVRARPVPAGSAYQYVTLTVDDNQYTGHGALWYPAEGLNPDLSGNLFVVPPPATVFAGQVVVKQQYTGSRYNQVEFSAPAGATAITIKKNGVTQANGGNFIWNLQRFIDKNPVAMGSTVTYEVTAWKDTNAGPPVSIPVKISPAFAPGIPAVGWYEVPNSQYITVAPDCAAPPAPSRCGAVKATGVVRAYSGSAIDGANNRILLFGGGHLDYFGNEVYEVCLDGSCTPNLVTPQDPIPPSWVFTNEDMGNGRPASRHTFGGIRYVASTDHLYISGGSLSPSGYSSNAIWRLHVGTATWEKLAWTGPEIGAFGNVADGFGHILYEHPADNNLYLKTYKDFFRYNPASNVMAKLNPANWDISIYANGALDTHNDAMVMARGTNVAIIRNVSGSPTFQGVYKTTVKNFGANPGVAYDSDKKRVVIWNGGNVFGVVDVAANTYQEVTVPDGPGEALHNGTFTRIGYLPDYKAFAIQNWEFQNVFIVKID